MGRQADEKEYERATICYAWLKTMKHWSKPVELRNVLLTSLGHGYWSSRRNDPLYRETIALCKRLDEPGPRRLPLAGGFVRQQALEVHC